MIDLQDVKVKNTEDWDSICPFPVGFVYMSTSKTSPAATYGGQWTNLAENRFPRFISTSYAALGKGGSSRHRHLVNIGKNTGEEDIYLNDNGDVNYSYSTIDYNTDITMDLNFVNGSRVISSKTSGNMLRANSIPGTSIIKNTPSRFGSTGGTTVTPPYVNLYAWYRAA